MKKVFLCAAAVAMLGLAACSNKNAENADTVNADTLVEVEAVTDTLVDSANPADTTVVNAAEVAEEVVAPEAAK